MAAQQITLDFAGKRGKSASVVSAKGRKMRITGLFILCLFWAFALMTRLYVLQVVDGQKWQEWALKQHFTDIELASERGPIFDRNENLLAVSVPAGSVYARPKGITDKKLVAGQLSELLGMDKKLVLAKLNESKPFVWIQRQLPRQTAEKVQTLGHKGVGFMLESKRLYPFNSAASTLVGKVGVDGNGLSGIEKIFERQLHEKNRKAKVVRDAFGKNIQITEVSTEKFELPKGSAVRLTIDSDIQQIMDEETEAGQSNANAKAVTAIMVDAQTGEVLGMSQSDSPNFNLSHGTDPKELKNIVVEQVFEPGSIFKPLVAAAAIDAGVVRATDIINCENGRFPFMKHVIKDVHPSASIPFFDVVVRSSNIGMTKVGIRLGKDKLYESIRRFGFGESTGLGLPGESGGILRPVSQWSGVDVGTHSFGQGVAVTPLQVVRAVAAIANGGKLPKLKLHYDGEGLESEQIIGAKAADIAKEMMYGVVEDEHGTGGKAEIEGVRVGGKTGTAQKARKDGRGYDPGMYVASFVGFADASAIGITKTLTLIVSVDEPHAGTIYGGTLAAPVFKRIMQRSLHMLMTRNEIKSIPSKPIESSPYVEASYSQQKGIPQIDS